MCYNSRMLVTTQKKKTRVFNEEQKRGRYEANKRRVKKLREEGGEAWRLYQENQKKSMEKFRANQDPEERKKGSRERQARYRAFHPELHLYNSARSRAKKKGLEFSITLDDIVLPELCPVLGIAMRKNDNKCKDSSYSLDRVDNSKGYIKENIQVISNKANTLKNGLTPDLCDKIKEYMVKHWPS